MRLLSVLGASQALGEHLRRHPEHWHELTDPTLGSTRPPAYAMRAALLRAVGCRSRRRASRWRPWSTAPPRTRCGWSTAGCCSGSPPATWPTTSASTTRPPSSPTSPPGPSTRRWPWPGRKVGEAAISCRLAVIAMGKCGGHELNYVSDVDVIFVAEPVEGVRTSGDAAMRAATQLASTMMQVCSDNTARGHHLAGRRQPAPRGQVGPARAHARQPPRLLRALGEDLGVPGAAQGPTGGRGPGARSGVRRADRPAGVVGGRARRVRRGGAGDAPPGARPHPGRHRPSGSSSSARADCATSSSPYSCCRWCTAAPTRRCDRRRR